MIKYNIRLLKKNTHGSVFDTITRSTFDEIEVDVPDLDVQKKIGYLLSELDKKIELNNKINNNLEQQIEAILLSFIENTNSNNVKLGDYLYIKGRIGWKGLKKTNILNIQTSELSTVSRLLKLVLIGRRLDIYPNLDTMNPPK